MALLEIENLSVEFPSHNGVMHAVDGVSLSVDTGEVHLLFTDDIRDTPFHLLYPLSEVVGDFLELHDRLSLRTPLS